jgi:hypothetical protein
MDNKKGKFNILHLGAAFLVGGLIIFGSGYLSQGKNLQGKFDFRSNQTFSFDRSKLYQFPGIERAIILDDENYELSIDEDSGDSTPLMLKLFSKTSGYQVQGYEHNPGIEMAISLNNCGITEDSEEWCGFEYSGWNDDSTFEIVEGGEFEFQSSTSLTSYNVKLVVVENMPGSDDDAAVIELSKTVTEPSSTLMVKLFEEDNSYFIQAFEYEVGIEMAIRMEECGTNESNVKWCEFEYSDKDHNDDFITLEENDSFTMFGENGSTEYIVKPVNIHDGENAAVVIELTKE